MEIITIYKTVNSEGKQIISYEPLPSTQCQIRYYLTASEDHILVNAKTNLKTQAIVVPKWEVSDWIEVDINN